jgi:hypothetical protein
MSMDRSVRGCYPPGAPIDDLTARFRYRLLFDQLCVATAH